MNTARIWIYTQGQRTSQITPQVCHVCEGMSPAFLKRPLKQNVKTCPVESFMVRWHSFKTAAKAEV